MKTFLGTEINPRTRGILYICKYNFLNKTIQVRNEVQFESAFDALEAYANIPNPESQMASGKDKESFERELTQLHNDLNNPKWVESLIEVL